MRKPPLFLLPLILSLTTARPADVTGPYFGQTPPGKTPEIFAPGILSLTNRLEDRIAFSPDCKECFFTVWGTNYSSAKIYWTRCVNNVWTPQVEAPFSVDDFASSPCFSPDGNRLYYHYANYRRPKPHGIWMVERTSQGWSEPKHLPPPINSDYKDGAYTETADGTAYFCSNRPGGQVLVAGGLGNSDVTNSAELHDPATGRSTPMPAERWTRPPHGHLVAGGCGKPVLPA